VDPVREAVLASFMPGLYERVKVNLAAMTTSHALVDGALLLMLVLAVLSLLAPSLSLYLSTHLSRTRTLSLTHTPLTRTLPTLSLSHTPLTHSTHTLHSLAHLQSLFASLSFESSVTPSPPLLSTPSQLHI
jgi:hypothetical protein